MGNFNEEKKRNSFEMKINHSLHHFTHTAVEVKEALAEGNCEKAIQCLMPPDQLVYNKRKSEIGFDFYAMWSYRFLFGIWALPPTFAQLQRLCQFIGDGLCLEIGAGRGAHTALLRAAGCRAIATDAEVCTGVAVSVHPDMEHFLYGEVQSMTASRALETYGAEADALLVVWSLQSPSASDLSHFKGSKAIVIGEYDGCTDAGALQPFCDGDVVDEKSEWRRVETWEHPHWDSNHDFCTLLEKVK